MSTTWGHATLDPPRVLDLAGVVSTGALDLAGGVSTRALDLAGVVSTRALDLAGVVSSRALDLAGVVSTRALDLAGISVLGKHLGQKPVRRAREQETMWRRRLPSEKTLTEDPSHGSIPRGRRTLRKSE